MHLERNSPILHVVDGATRVEAARWLSDMTLTTCPVWNALRTCWIGIYIGPLDHIMGQKLGRP